MKAGRLGRVAALSGAVATVLAGAFLAVAAAWDFLRFPLDRDETHFWLTSLRFSGGIFPSLEQLANYDDLNTPLPFVLFGVLEHLFDGGPAAARWLNLLAAYATTLVVALPRGGPTARSIAAALGLLTFPYFAGTATHLYTDPLATLFGVLAVSAHLGGRPFRGAAAGALAIASRQYLVAIPAALAVHELFGAGSPGPRRGWRDRPGRWLWPALAAATLLGWIALFGGFGPRMAVERQRIQTVQAARFFIDHALYFLACLGAYFVAIEALITRVRRDPFAGSLLPTRSRPSTRVALVAAAVLGVLFVFFPPLRNVGINVQPTMGFLDKAAHAVLRFDAPRLVLFWSLATWAALRLLRDRSSLAFWIVAAHAVLLTKSHLGWDKYAMPVLAALWLLASRSARPSVPQGLGVGRTHGPQA